MVDIFLRTYVKNCQTEMFILIPFVVQSLDECCTIFINKHKI